MSLTAKFDRSVAQMNLKEAERYASKLDAKALEYLAPRGISKPVAEKYKLGISDSEFAGRLSIPYIRRAGVVGFNFRSLDGGQPKYISRGPRHLYNLDVLDYADRTGEIGICEGELDSIVATELYGFPAVGIPGATQWTGNKHWPELFRGYSKIWVLADPDDAGMKLAEAITTSLPVARVVSLPMDVSDCWINKVDIRKAM